ncbi:hypothetical protein [Merismopedia glauca]|uniref:Uncharacterized protein n=1 Tax=Merismopedia glauca CCAP 1448/3 TaxID=1296344 RepID=A0A2T1BZB0_9CYAN|nr:hypothetical protein [Merismopedia glauca]PSB01359.1 hypothetical protein C7B64_18660 [Merismopedia glauca CCAP 1448/3]
MATTSYKLLCGFLVLGLSGCSSDWSSTKGVVPDQLLQEAATKYTTTTERSLSSAKARKFGQITVVDFRNQDLCGRLGCLYFLIYDEKVSALYLKPLQAGLFQQDGSCLLIRQPEPQNQRENRFCPNNGELSLVDSRLIN